MSRCSATSRGSNESRASNDVGGGRHAIVTSGGSGIGAAAAAELALLGARLTLIGQREGPLAETCARLGGEHSYQVADVTLPDSVKSAFERAGPAAILVNTAGAAESAPFRKTDLALLDRTMAV